MEDYGSFLEITPGVEGLIHISEVSWSSAPESSREFFKLGDTYEAIVMTIDREERKMSLSIKRLSEDPWTKVADKFPVGTRITGEVKKTHVIDKTKCIGCGACFAKCKFGAISVQK